MSEADTIRETTTVHPGIVDCAGMSNAGRVHALNADSLLVADLNPFFPPTDSASVADRGTRLLAVADGIGREWLGQRASTLAVEYLDRSILTRDFPHQTAFGSDEILVDGLLRTYQGCQARLREIADKTPDYAGMGTTLTLAYVAWPALTLLHVGDSRCYLNRVGYLDRLTTDHTVAERMIAEGFVSREQLQHSRWHNVLWNTVSASSQDVSPEVRRLRLRTGDSLLLCTDGLTRHLSDRQIRETLQQNLSAHDTCQKLIEMANLRGGEDNITVVVARCQPTFQGEHFQSPG